jgi:hypothetical protein
MTTRFAVPLALLLLTGCAASAGQVSPSASVTTAVQGWEHWFRIDWSAKAKPNGADIDGYVYNSYGRPAANVQILAQALDAAGSVVGQKIEWVSGGIPAFNRGYFRVPGLPPASAYRVSVWAFDFIDNPRWPR